MKCDSFNASVGNLNEVDGYDCPICKNKGVHSVPQLSDSGHWYELCKYCKCHNIRQNIRRLMKSGLKNIISDYTFEKYHDEEPWQKAVKKAAMKFTKDDDNTWFFVGGASGSGKTHICTAIAGHYLNQGKTVKYMLWRDDVVRLKASVNDIEAYEKMMNEFKTAEVLYIDDLFKTGKAVDGQPQKPTGADINIAFELLNYRYNNPALITLISSESRVTDILDIDEAIGGRIAERTIQHGYGINIKPDRNKNYRLKGSVEL
jgi:DNA replication protein DnaC